MGFNKELPSNPGPCPDLFLYLSSFVGVILAIFMNFPNRFYIVQLHDRDSYR